MLQRLLRSPWGFPLVVSVAFFAIVVNEAMHRGADAGRVASKSADQVHHQANRAHYYALDRANSLRAYMLQGDNRWIKRYNEASAELEKSVEFIRVEIQKSGARGTDLASRLPQLLVARSVDTRQAHDLAIAGRRDEALEVLKRSDDEGRGIALRNALQESIDLAQAWRAKVDDDLAKVIDRLRWALHGLIVAMLVAAYAMLRQTTMNDSALRRHAETLSEQVAERTAQLRELAGHLITTREDERSRLARELHDEMGGLMSAIKLHLARLLRNADLPVAARENIGAIDKRASEVIQLKRRVIESLRPSALDHLGLVASLSLLCRDHASAMQVPTHENFESLELESELELTIYRFVQEALTNARKYSKATEVWVSLARERESVHAIVEDNGVGFSGSTTGLGHHGIAGMRLRVEAHGGELTIGGRADGRGARLHAKLPFRVRATPAEDAA